MKSITYIITLALAAFLITSCVPYEEEILSDIRLDYSDGLLQKIYDFQDRQLSDSLYVYFDHRDPTYRYAAARAFASYKDVSAIPQLSQLLEDPILEVRSMAAYSLGQLGDAAGADALARAFDNMDTLGFNRQFNAQILEAVGKCGNAEHLEFISSVKNYRNSDTSLLLGQARSIYRFMLRDVTSPAAAELMANRLIEPGTPIPSKLYAAHYLSRAKEINLTDQLDELVKSLRREDDPAVRMALAYALARTGSDEVLPALLSLLKSDPDYRVRCNILKGMGNFDYGQIGQEVARVLLTARNPHVANVAADYFIENGSPTEAAAYRRMALDSLTDMAQVKMLQAANKHLPVYFEQTKTYLNFDLRQRFTAAKDPYIKAAILQALSEYPWNYRVIHGLGSESDVPVIQISTIQALGNIAGYENFNVFFGASARPVRAELAQYLQRAIESSDLGVMAEAASVIAQGGLPYKVLYDNADFLRNAQKRIPLPQGIETYNMVQEAIDFMEGTETPTPKAVDFNNPIEWEIVKAIDANTRAVVETPKGNITLRFYDKQSPATVANFIELAKENYFDGKLFHRVVPNFVAQGGGARGDGYGSAGYSIRSELSILYYDQAGKVGMASSGRHTESTQFFITHSPTPHLDGRYTIFAQVVEGMDVVHKLLQGDKITDVKISE